MIERINRLPHGHLRFRDFASLRVPGRRDEFSALRLPDLRERVGGSVVHAVESDMGAGPPRPLDEREQASAYRWMLRGLDPDKACRKVRTDSEISANAIEAISGKGAERRWHRPGRQFDDGWSAAEDLDALRRDMELYGLKGATSPPGTTCSVKKGDRQR